MEQDIGKVYKFKINKLEEENSKLQENNEEIKEKFLRNIEETEKIKKQLQSNIRVFNKTIDEQNKKIKELEEKNKKNLIEIICYQEELENSIPVSLVEEKIEELNEYYKKEIYPSLMNWSDIDITEYYDGMIGILQELLEKR